MDGNKFIVETVTKKERNEILQSHLQLLPSTGSSKKIKFPSKKDNDACTAAI